jgi:endonuclease/exonuclease/phosphatase family metal-dependent hydrolase
VYSDADDGRAVIASRKSDTLPLGSLQGVGIRRSLPTADRTLRGGRWCDLRRNSRSAYTTNILAVGDFNLPERNPGDPIYDALTKRGLQLPPHTTRIPRTNIANTADYDQIAFVPGLKRHIKTMGVFDFDGTIFRDLWNPPATSYWRTCAKYYVSDHRPLWAQLELPV